MSRPFRSKLASQFEEFILNRKAARRWSGSYEDNLHFFDNYFAESYPDSKVLCNGMLDWCRERPTENGNACRYRITVVANFVRYANKRGWTDVMPPIVPSNCPCTYIPHAFTDDEIISLFKGIDAHVVKSQSLQNTMDRRLNALELPVYVRLLYSTGMRTNKDSIFISSFFYNAHNNNKVMATLPVRNQTAYCRTSPLCQPRMLSPASPAPQAMKLNVPSMT